MVNRTHPSVAELRERDRINRLVLLSGLDCCNLSKAEEDALIAAEEKADIEYWSEACDRYEAEQARWPCLVGATRIAPREEGGENPNS